VYWLHVARLDDVTADAELQEKSAADVRYITDLLLSQSSEAVREHDDKMKEQSTVSSTTPPTEAQPAAAAECMSLITLNYITFTLHYIARVQRPPETMTTK